MKFFPPLGQVPHKISQTTHGHKADVPTDLSKQQAIDFSAVGNAPLSASHDGTITNVVSSGTGSYFVLDVGKPFLVLYVHSIAEVTKGAKVTKGQRIGRVYPMNASHVHYAFQNKNGTRPTDNPMEYMDRATRFYATHPDIIKVWCKTNGDVKWELFADKKLPAPITVPNFPIGTKLKVKVDNLRLRKSPSTSGNIIRMLNMNEEVEIISDKFEISGNYSFMLIRSRIENGYSAYSPDWFEVIKDDCPEKLSEALKTNERLELDIRFQKDMIESFKMDLRNRDEAIKKHLERIEILEKKLKGLQERVNSTDSENKKMKLVIEKSEEIVENSTNIGWLVSQLVEAIKKAFARSE
jgi:uncharacterized coiled-coil protein SlyX